MPNQILQGDNLNILRVLDADSIDLIYIDPPFNTGKRQKSTRNATYFEDDFENYLGFLEPRLVEALRILKPSGSLFVHLDWREVHYVKVLLDQIFGFGHFVNEIIWAYDYGGRSKSKWSAKHDTILFYAVDPSNYTFNFDAMDRIPYMAPGLVGKEKAAKGKTPTDVWWHTIVPTNGKERTGYPTQKPLGVLERIIKVHSNPGDLCLDFFAGSGTLGEAAAKNNREFLLIDENSDAIEVMKERLCEYLPQEESPLSL